MPDITVEEARSLLSYEPDAGVFRWRKTMCRSARAGDVAGGPWGNGYIGIQVAGQRFLAHRLAWLYVNGCWPSLQIDHINGNRADNRISNLRDVDAATNQQNRHRPQGASPLLWASFKKRENRWRGAFRVNGREVTVGSFRTAEEAHAAVLARRASMGIGAEGAPPIPVPTAAQEG